MHEFLQLIAILLMPLHASNVEWDLLLYQTQVYIGPKMDQNLTIQIKTSELQKIIHSLMAVSPTGGGSPTLALAHQLSLEHFGQRPDLGDPAYLKIVGQLIEEYNEY